MACCASSRARLARERAPVGRRRQSFAAALSELESDDAVYVAGKLDPEERALVLVGDSACWCKSHSRFIPRPAAAPTRGLTSRRCSPSHGRSAVCAEPPRLPAPQALRRSRRIRCRRPLHCQAPLHKRHGLRPELHPPRGGCSAHTRPGESSGRASLRSHAAAALPAEWLPPRHCPCYPDARPPACSRAALQGPR